MNLLDLVLRGNSEMTRAHFLMRFNCFVCMLQCDKILFMYAWGLGWVTTKQRRELLHTIIFL